MTSRTLPRSVRRRGLARAGVVGLAALVSAGLAMPSAGAAPAITIPLDPAAVALGGNPVENFGGAVDPLDDLGTLTFVPAEAEYGDTLTVELPTEFDTTGATVDLELDDNGDEVADRTFSTSDATLTVTGAGTRNLSFALPAAGGATISDGLLVIGGLTTGLGPEFTVDPVGYFLAIDATTRGDVTLRPELTAESEVLCPSAAACTVTAGSTVGLSLPATSLLRDLGIADFTGARFGLQELDANGAPTTGAPIELPVQVVDTSSATVDIPATIAPGSYALLVVQPAASGLSLVLGELAVTAPAPAPVAAPPATPSPTATPSAPAPGAPSAANVGLRSNTGVEDAAPASGASATVALGAGLLALSGIGGIAVALTRRRPAVEGGTCQP
ncbi:hypothetical protein [Blastococcus goldschmidtiae]|uniref:LPXTG-motif cell wall anchor domain-containing protein n=1 Tax=Blastococcus goldschmidtiae TaxID=3075546 RepID=A0ABU2K8J8_9ACTN|nr:hypothetical protein [Blastococcus sp. DSM 46792]MDT0276509.1 hypothetical protein [Blastococcus sp. DSM 46792]